MRTVGWEKRFTEVTTIMQLPCKIQCELLCDDTARIASVDTLASKDLVDLNTLDLSGNKGCCFHFYGIAKGVIFMLVVILQC